MMNAHPLSGNSHARIPSIDLARPYVHRGVRRSASSRGTNMQKTCVCNLCVANHGIRAGRSRPRALSGPIVACAIWSTSWNMSLARDLSYAWRADTRAWSNEKCGLAPISSRPSGESLARTAQRDLNASRASSAVAIPTTMSYPCTLVGARATHLSWFLPVASRIEGALEAARVVICQIATVQLGVAA